MDDRHSIHIPHSIKAFGVLTIWSKLRHINISTISNLIQFKCVGPPNQKISRQLCHNARLTIPVIQRYYVHLFFFKSSIGIPCVIPLFIQLSPLSTLPNRHLAHNLCGVHLGFDRYVYGKNIYIRAILDRHGYRCRCSSWSHQLSGEQSIEIGVLAIKDTHSSKSCIAGPTTSSS